jgi:hypothetical protein
VFDALLRSKDSCLIYQLILNNAFTKLSKVSMSKLLFLRIESLGLCCFRASRVVAGSTNERLEARCVGKCPSCRFDARRRLQHSDTCYSELQFDSDHSQLSLRRGTSIKMRACSTSEMGGQEVLMRLSLCFPGPTSAPRPASRAGAMLRSVEAQSDASEHALILKTANLWDEAGAAEVTFGQMQVQGGRSCRAERGASSALVRSSS